MLRFLILLVLSCLPSDMTMVPSAAMTASGSGSTDDCNSTTGEITTRSCTSETPVNNYSNCSVLSSSSCYITTISSSNLSGSRTVMTSASSSSYNSTTISVTLSTSQGSFSSSSSSSSLTTESSSFNSTVFITTPTSSTSLNTTSATMHTSMPYSSTTVVSTSSSSSPTPSFPTESPAVPWILYGTIAGGTFIFLTCLAILICFCCFNSKSQRKRNRLELDDSLEMQEFKKNFSRKALDASIISGNAQKPEASSTETMITKSTAPKCKVPLLPKTNSPEKKDDAQTSTSGHVPAAKKVPASDEFVEPDPIQVREFCKHVKQLHEDNNQLFISEYASLSTPVSLPREVGMADYNMAKNRFKDIISYDHSRVVLKEEPGVQGSDYINANYIDGYLKEKMYIAAQGPTNKTVDDFWRMVWEHKLRTIVMLTRCVEGDRIKCYQYWPDQLKKTVVYDSGISVTLQNLTSFAAYEYRKIIIKQKTKHDIPNLEVTLFQYTVWPDHGVPQQSNSLMAFIRRVRVAHPPQFSAPLLVHCSAGVGRSGTFITLDSMMMCAKQKGTVDVYGFVKKARKQRAQMVQTEAQYRFIHDALDDFIKFGDTTIESSKLPTFVQNAVDDKGLLVKQFQMLEECSPLVNEFSCSEALLPCNLDKNRFVGILPFNKNRVILRSSDRKQQYYINASMIDNYSHRSGYLATQTPLPKTGKELWRMVWEFQSLVIVTLEEEEQLLMVEEEGAAIEAGKMTIILKEQQKNKGFVKRTYQLSSKIPSSHHEENVLKVIQYQLASFPTLVRGSSRAMLFMMDRVLKTQMSTGNHPITVMCPDGSGRSGVFMVAYSELEKLKVEGLVDVFQCVRTMRTRRPGIIADVEQYELCYRILADYLASVETYSNFC